MVILNIQYWSNDKKTQATICLRPFKKISGERPVNAAEYEAGETSDNIIKMSKLRDKFNILIIEGRGADSFIIRKMLESKSIFKYTRAKSGSEALELGVSKGFDMILVDISIPFINWIDLTRTIRQSEIKIPILAMTSDVSEKTLERCYEAGMNGFVSKPFVARELINKIMNLLPGMNNDLEVRYEQNKETLKFLAN